MIVRTWNILVLLRQRRRSLEELSIACGATTRTIRRDLDALAQAGFPIANSRDDVDKQTKESFWSLEPLDAWPRRELTPMRPLETYASHAGYAVRVRE